MIELIFVIVIIGILAAVALPKLAATRDDAKISKSIINLKVCVRDIGSSYTARAEEDNTSAACEAVATEGCFRINAAGLGATSGIDGNITTQALTGTNAGENWCNDAAQISKDQNLTDGTATPYTHSFGGSKVEQ